MEMRQGLGDFSLVRVVGAGTAGSAAAAQIARGLPSSTVLLLDQGYDHSDSPNVWDNDKFFDVQQSPQVA